ncbi:alpha/beta fold hydrolase [Mycolicibacterium xanthum]|uniref:alpha/beta fold hydrolase n=1 Tax=Mycolicibacterium xanthum TaxID=2796469 RepID=UPI0027E19325|nr:alpha/beta fold hydrolase [Mycolicibacterium xanthum]
MRQELRFCTATDGVRLAYATSGHGPVVVKAGHWMTHLERDWTSPVWRHWVEFLSREHTLVRYDERGCGLSDRECPALTLENWVGDLEAVVAAAGVERFSLLGASGGGPVAIAYAARHPDRVSQLVLYGTYARGRVARDPTPETREEAQTFVALTRMGWGRSNPAFRRVFTTLFIPGGSDAQMAWFDELQRASSSGEHAARSRAVRYAVDVRDLARSITVPTLVLHVRDDAVVPFDEGRNLAALIPGATFVPLDSANHILLDDEPAWADFCAQLRGFLPAGRATPTLQSGLLTDREIEVLRLVAAGMDNGAIAAAMHLSVRTVERHLSNCYAKLGVGGKSARAAAAARLATLES